jgi:hypothetical protein
MQPRRRMPRQRQEKQSRQLAPRARASRCSATASNTVFVSSCASSRCPKVQDRRLIRDRIASELQIAERARRLDIVERFLGARIRQIVSLLQAVDAQHHGDRKRPTTALRALLRIMRRDHCCRIRHDHHDRTRGLGLSRRDPRHDRERGSARCQMEKSTTPEFHSVRLRPSPSIRHRCLGVTTA